MAIETKLTAAIDSTAETQIYVENEEGFAPGKTIVIDGEAMSILSTQGPGARVMRGVHGTRTKKHSVGAIVTVGSPAEFGRVDIFGKMKLAVATLLCMFLFAWQAPAQVTTASTTLSAAITSTSDTFISVTSTTGFVVGTTIAYVDGEALAITSITGTRVGVRRGSNGTRAATHANASVIFVGPPTYFLTEDPQRGSTCTAASQGNLPKLNLTNGKMWDCFSSVWTEVQRSFLVFEGSINDAYEMTITGTNPTADRTITFQDATGTVVLRDSTDTLTNKTLTAPAITSGVLTSNTVTTDIRATAAGGATLGTTALPFSTIFMSGASGTPASNQFNITGASTGGVRTVTLPDSTFTVGTIEVSYAMLANGSLADQAFFIANRAYYITAIREVHSVAGNDAGAVDLQVVKDTGTDAPGAGTDLLTDGAGAGLSLKATANTVQTGTLTATAATKTLAAGNRLSVDFAGALTTLAGVVVTVTLVPIN